MAMSEEMEIGQRIRAIREERGYTANYVVQRVAQRRGTSQSLSGWGLKQFEEGKKTLRLDVFLAVLKVLDVRFELLKD
jgi:transcriptional regulator with XRE-family HTH domain